MQYIVDETGSVDRHELLIVPRYSKTPHGRDGTVGLVLPSYAVWHAPDIIRAAFYQYLGGDPKQVGAVAQSKLRDVLHEFQEGVRS